MSDLRKPSAAGGTVLASQGAQKKQVPPPPIPRSGQSAAPSPSPAEPPAAADGDELVGTVLAERYKILRRLGEGGMGTVYLAEHTTINKKLALKVLSNEFSHKQDLVDRFLQEARAASMIEQENVVEITDFGSTPQGSVFFVMEYLNGEDLSQTVAKSGPLPWTRVKPIMLQICRALHAAHDRGIIHRDMKPENCYRIKRGRTEDFIKVLDFGIAKVTSEETEGGKGLTRTGMIFGTPEYMSPEQAKGERPDHRVDVYAVGVILYELLTGRVPFTADTFMGILTKHMFEAPPAPSQVAPTANISAEIEAIILKALQKDREYRFQSMAEMAEAIEAVGTGGAAVSVVNEHIERPAEGRMGFTQVPSTVPPGTSLDHGPASSSGRGILIAVAAVLTLAFGIGGWALFGQAEEETPVSEPTPLVAAPAPQPAAPIPEPEVAPTEPQAKVLSAAAPKVTFKILTPGVDARILDARDEGMYGSTNSEEGVQVEKSEESLKLILRAEGYEDLEVSIVPDRDKTFRKTMTKEVKKTKKRRRPTTSKPANTQPKPQTDASGSKPKSPPRRTTKRDGPVDLKDPFKN